MAYQDIELVCKECGRKFTWTAGEQKFFEEKGLQNPPAHCPEHRGKGRKPVQTFPIKCSNCGRLGETRIPIRYPDSVLCSVCFKEKREKGEATAVGEVSTPKTGQQFGSYG